jgi:GNAT superfamily N-acetyltransferase
VPDDAAAVGDVIVAAGRAAWSHIFDTGRMRQDPARWAAMIEEAERFWVAEDGGRVVGFAAAGPATDAARGGDCGELLMLHVHPEAWGTGVAGRLHDTALEHLAATGFTRAVLRTEERNHRALAFYRRRGWTPDGTALEREHEGARLREPWLVRSLV